MSICNFNVTFVGIMLVPITEAQGFQPFALNLHVAVLWNQGCAHPLSPHWAWNSWTTYLAPWSLENPRVFCETIFLVASFHTFSIFTLVPCWARYYRLSYVSGSRHLSISPSFWDFPPPLYTRGPFKNWFLTYWPNFSVGSPFHAPHKWKGAESSRPFHHRQKGFPLHAGCGGKGFLHLQALHVDRSQKAPRHGDLLKTKIYWFDIGKYYTLFFFSF